MSDSFEPFKPNDHEFDLLFQALDITVYQLDVVIMTLRIHRQPIKICISAMPN